MSLLQFSSDLVVANATIDFVGSSLNQIKMSRKCH